MTRSAIWKWDIHRLQARELWRVLLRGQFMTKKQNIYIPNQWTPPMWFISIWIWQELASPHRLEMSSLRWKIWAFTLLSLLDWESRPDLSILTFTRWNFIKNVSMSMVLQNKGSSSPGYKYLHHFRFKRSSLWTQNPSVDFLFPKTHWTSSWYQFLTSPNQWACQLPSPDGINLGIKEFIPTLTAKRIDK